MIMIRISVILYLFAWGLAEVGSGPLALGDETKRVDGVSKQVTQGGIERLAQDLVMSDPQRAFMRSAFAAYQVALREASEQRRSAKAYWQIEYLIERFPDEYGHVDPASLTEEERRQNMLAKNIAYKIGDRMIGIDSQAVIADNEKSIELWQILADREGEARKAFRASLLPILADTQVQRIDYAWRRLDIASMDGGPMDHYIFVDPVRNIDMLTLIDDLLLQEERLEMTAEAHQELDDLLHAFVFRYQAAYKAYFTQRSRDFAEWAFLQNQGRYDLSTPLYDRMQRRKKDVWTKRLRLVDDVGGWLERHESLESATRWRRSALKAFCPGVYNDDLPDIMIHWIAAQFQGELPEASAQVYDPFVKWRDLIRERMARQAIYAVCEVEFGEKLHESEAYRSLGDLHRIRQSRAKAISQLLLESVTESIRPAADDAYQVMIKAMRQKPSPYRHLSSR